MLGFLFKVCYSKENVDVIYEGKINQEELKGIEINVNGIRMVKK